MLLEENMSHPFMSHPFQAQSMAWLLSATAAERDATHFVVQHILLDAFPGRDGEISERARQPCAAGNSLNTLRNQEDGSVAVPHRTHQFSTTVHEARIKLRPTL